MAKQRDIRVKGIRRPFEVGRFVLAVMVHAETLAEAEAGASPDQDEITLAKSAKKPSDDETDGTTTIWERDASSPRSDEAGKEAA